MHDGEADRQHRGPGETRGSHLHYEAMCIASASTIRTPAFPSQPSGPFAPTSTRPVFSACSRALTIPCSVGGHGTRVFVLSVTVTGRSVVSRTVRHGTPSTVVSSCTPPESVITAAAQSSSASISTYPTGSVTRNHERRLSYPNSRTRARVRG